MDASLLPPDVLVGRTDVANDQFGPGFLSNPPSETRLLLPFWLPVMDQAGASSGFSRPARHRPAPMPVPSPDRTGSPSITASSSNMAASSSRTGGMYDDPATDELCRMETFQDTFDSRQFLAGLSERLIARSKADPGPFNARPFIRTFETAVGRLQDLKKQLQDEQATMASSVQVAQSAYSSKLRELSSHFTAVSQSFSSLESRFSEVSKTTVGIGEQLESIDRQKSRALEAHDLIEHYYAFARGDTSKLDRLRKEGGREGRLKTAIIARRLGAISREIDIPGAENTREAVDRYNERFERDMLKLFDKFYRKSDPRMMGHIARVLQNFNGGQSCVQIYVNQHDFFISKDRVGEAGRMESSPIWQTLPDPDAYPPHSEPSLAALFNEIRSTVEQEAQIIAAVFPHPLTVMQTFLQRVFAQSVQAYVEVLMSKAAEVGASGVRGGGGLPTSSSAGALAPPNQPNTQTQQNITADPSSITNGASGFYAGDLSFLRVLQMARSMSLALISDLKVYDFRGPGRGPSKGEASPSLGILNGASDSNEGGHTHSGYPLLHMLESSVEEIYVPYMEGQKYLERETKSLTELYAAYLAKFTQYHRQTHKVKTSTIFDRVRAAAGGSSNSATSGTAAGASSSSGVAQGSTASGGAQAPAKSSAFSKLSGFVDRARGATNAQTAQASIAEDANAEIVAGDGTPVGSGEQVEENDGELSLTVAERMLRWHAEAIGRCIDLSNPSEVGRNAFALFKVLSEAFLKSYLETAIDAALTQVSQADVRGANLPDLSPLRVLRQVDNITSLWQHYVTVALLPLTSSSVTLRREMAIFNNHNLLRVEGRCDALVQKIVDNIVSYLSNRLATQKKNDFAPKNDELAFSRMNTDPCIACSEALERVAKIVRSSLTGKNVEVVLSEIGIAFHSLLLDHFKKYTVSAAGGLMITKDLAMYQDSISTFNIPALNDRFEMLRSLGNLFIVQPSVLKGYMREGQLGKIDERLLHAFLLRRSDYAKEVRDLERSGWSSSSAGQEYGDGQGQGLTANATNTGSIRPGSSSGGAAAGSGRLSMMLNNLERYAAGQDISSISGSRDSSSGTASYDSVHSTHDR
ncbi:unnamed protein product [Sympodiomycopsis kandeliae]